jgi:predicted transcriptional regulator
MTPAGSIALATLLLTNMGTVLAAWLSVTTLKRGIAKENANRRITLEEYVNEVDRYHRNLRTYLLDLADAGVIDIRKVDLTKFPPPPVPKYNGNGK